jgi:hypothetical protein
MSTKGTPVIVVCEQLHKTYDLKFVVDTVATGTDFSLRILSVFPTSCRSPLLHVYVHPSTAGTVCSKY